MSNEGYLPLESGFATLAIHAHQSPDQWNSGAVITPIVTASTYKLQSADYSTGFQYGRWGNPTRNNLEGCLAALDKGKHALVFATGCAATWSALTILKSGDHILCAADIYGGTHHLVDMVAQEKGVDLEFFDVNNLSSFEKMFKPTTKMVWIESPTNPLCKVVDVRKVAAISHKQPGVLVVMDNTFLTSYFSKPLALGIDIVMYSMTKYMNGHSDVIMGALVLNDDDVHARLRDIQQHGGAVPGPFDCYLALRGLKTLALRMKQHMKNGIEVAQYLKKHSLVEEVLHPGFPDHPGHEVLKKQCSGYCGMLAFKIKGAGMQEVSKFLKALKMIVYAGSLGGCDSLAESPALLSHKYLSKEERLEIGITDNLIRLSVGIEEAEDITKDIDQALKAAFV
ncbi:cystathionine gamma-lyase-like [Neocloeon triangulifer]|uniref:cystathionine gamma-lyase-like n=1 Tax=Neocloeon triangulifer TaxID=2078957 RepID=UPI00286F412D|nr:cystathionine gamma-lyase-like [Neocloeon triangulifer]